MAVGFPILPRIIFKMCQLMYSVPDICAEFNITYATTGLIAITVCIVGATLLSCINELKETPATLMRPKSPKAREKSFFRKNTFYMVKVKIQ